MKTYNWGFWGTGNIARSMAAALGDVPGANRAAVAGRRGRAAQSFARRWGFTRAYDCYEALLRDQAVDIVYIATPNALHKDNILAALDAGKHVLCEKPLTLSPQQSSDCFDVAEAKGLILMEALWTAFFPAMQKAIHLVQSGTIGVPRYLSASFVSIREPANHPNLFDPALGGGARNDLGIYPIAAALMLAGPVKEARSQALVGPTGVDEMSAWTLAHENGALSLLSCGFRAELPVALRVVGTKGSLEIPQDFHHASRLVVETPGGQETLDLPYIGNGYAHEAVAFQARIDEGQKDGQMIWGRAETISAVRLMQSPLDPVSSL